MKANSINTKIRFFLWGSFHPQKTIKNTNFLFYFSISMTFCMSNFGWIPTQIGTKILKIGPQIAEKIFAFYTLNGRNLKDLQTLTQIFSLRLDLPGLIFLLMIVNILVYHTNMEWLMACVSKKRSGTFSIFVECFLVFQSTFLPPRAIIQ